MIETVQHQPDPVILITINLITIQNDFFFYVELSINVEKKLNKYQFPIFPLEEMENKNEKKIAFCLFVFFPFFFAGRNRNQGPPLFSAAFGRI